MEVSPLRALTLSILKLIIIDFSVEMKVSPLRALTQINFNRFHNLIFCVEMKVSPLRALTLFSSYQSSHNISVEMGVSPLRALTPCHVAACQKGCMLGGG